jgi:SOS response regulatory protein OraA/RecX
VEPARQTALEAAAKALARRDRSVADLTAYLERKGVDPDEVRTAVERLRDAGYVDDVRYANARAEALADRGFGDDAVRFELEREGLAADRIAAALLALPPERERAIAFLARARTPLLGIRRLAAKGFSADAIESAVAHARVEDGG